MTRSAPASSALEQPAELGRVVLAVGVHHHHDVGARVERSLGSRGAAPAALPWLWRSVSSSTAGCSAISSATTLRGVVGRPVVDDQHPAPGLEGLHLGQDAGHQHRQVVGLVERRITDPQHGRIVARRGERTVSQVWRVA